MQEEFSRTIPLSDIGRAEITKEYAATPEELKALAKRFDIVGIDSFNLSVKLSFEREGEYTLSGHFTAEIRDKSVITLTPVSYEVSDSFNTVFSRYAEETEESFDIDSPDTELLEGNEIDVGRIAAEYLALSLDSFPHNDGEVFAYNKDNAEKDIGPFAALQKLKGDS